MDYGLAECLEGALDELAQHDITFRRSDKRLIWALVDMLEEDYGIQTALETVALARDLIAQACDNGDYDFTQRGVFIHFIATNIEGQHLIITNMGDDGR